MNEVEISKMKVLTKLSFALAFLGGAVLLLAGALLGFMASTGGLYGNGPVSDATLVELSAGLLILVLGSLPFSLAVGLFVFFRRRLKALKWLRWIGWISVLGGWFAIYWNVRWELLSWDWSSSNDPTLVLPYLPYLLGLTGCMIALRRVGKE